MSEYILELKDITKQFPGVKALDRMNFQLKRGEVHALLGENGAGKSTLMKVLSGIYQPDEGQILLNGQSVHFANHCRGKGRHQHCASGAGCIQYIQRGGEYFHHQSAENENRNH